MDAKPLFTEDRADIVAYYCGHCRTVRGSQLDAEQCCTDIHCDCGKKIGVRNSAITPRLTPCADCKEKSHIKSVKDGLRKAERITTPTTKFVFSDCISQHNGFFPLESIDDAIDLSAGDDMPFFVYDCDRQVWGGIGPASELIEAALEGDWFDGAEDHAVHVDELQASLNQWNAKQNIEQFVWTDKRIIVLDEKRFEEWLNSEEGLL